MKHKVLWVLALFFSSGSALAADKPDVSGVWKMNLDDSFFGTTPEPTSYVRKITLKDASLVIDDDQEMQGQKQVFTRTMTTDGKPAEQQILGIKAVCSAQWDGNELVVTSEAPEMHLVYHDHMTLSADGKTLTSKLEVSAPQGNTILLVVFNKQ
jgi:hypothetical protein